MEWDPEPRRNYADELKQDLRTGDFGAQRLGSTYIVMADRNINRVTYTCSLRHKPTVSRNVTLEVKCRWKKTSPSVGTICYVAILRKFLFQSVYLFKFYYPVFELLVKKYQFESCTELCFNYFMKSIVLYWEITTSWRLFISIVDLLSMSLLIALCSFVIIQTSSQQ